MPRLFVAVDLPSRVREEAANLCHGVERAHWVDMSQFHLTLEFIGEVDAGRCEDIAAALEEVAAAPFALALKGVGHFPPRKAARVLWAGMSPSAELERLQAHVRGALRGIGVQGEDRTFHAHITLARFREPVPLHVVAPFIAAHSLFASAPFDVTEFHLYSSVLARSGAAHTIERTYPLDAG